MELRSSTVRVARRLVGSVSSRNVTFVAPYAQQWNFTVQRQLPWRMVAEIGYVGTNGKRLIGTGAPVNPGQICTIASPCVIPASLATDVSAADIPAGHSRSHQK